MTLNLYLLFFTYLKLIFIKMDKLIYKIKLIKLKMQE